MLFLQMQFLIVAFSSGIVCRCRRNPSWSNITLGRKVNESFQHGNDKKVSCDFKQETSSGRITWNNFQSGTKFSATPHCLSPTKIYKLTECTEGKLRNKVVCNSTQRPVSACPDDFIEEVPYCVQIIEGTYEGSSCPKGYQGEVYLNENLNKPIWLPYRRDLQYGIGEFVYQGMPGTPTIIFKNDYLARGINSFDCLTHSDGFVGSDLCNKTKRRLCTYWMMQHNEHHFCNSLGSDCHGSTFDQSTFKCLCSRTNCQYAVLKNPYQNMVTFDKPTSLGLEFNETLRWISNKEDVSYTFWSNENLIDFEKSVSIMHTGNGWRPSYFTTNLRVCEIDYNFTEPQISIHINDIQMYLKVQGQSSLAMNRYNEIIFCYTDSMPHHLFDTYATFRNDTKSFTFKVLSSGYYWCEGYSIDGFKKVSTNKGLVVVENVYTVEVVVNYTWFDKYDDPTIATIAYEKFIQKMEADFSKGIDFLVLFKWMQTLEVNEETHMVRYLIHIVTPFTDDLVNYFNIARNLWKIGQREWITNISELYHPTLCMPATEKYGKEVISWNITTAGTSAYANEICMDEQSRKIPRICNNNFYKGARWSKVNCFIAVSTESKWTDELNDLLEKNDTDEILDNLEVVTKNSQGFTPIDVYIISSILQKVTINNSRSLNQIITVMDNVMETKPETLRESQISLNATDRILYSFDVIVNANKFSISGNMFSSDNIILFTIDAAFKDFSGLAISKHAGTFSATRLLYGVSSDEIYKIPNLEVATFLPIQLLKLITEGVDTRVSITFLFSDALFNEVAEDREVIAANVAVLLPKMKDNVTFKIPIIFNPYKKLARRKRNCAYWKYGNVYDLRTKGSWKLERLPTYPGLRFLQCYYTHATHYGMLLSEEKLEYSDSLQIVTIVCLTLSLIGIIGIFVTALLFRTWLDNNGNKILVHYAAVSFVQIILFYISFYSQENYNDGVCVAVGALLQYTILAQFFWMLIIAFFQYKRYVQVLQAPSNWIFRKSMLVCYASPLIPVIVNLVFFQETYTEGSMGFCYPSGVALKYGVLLPIGLVVVANFFIFSVIIIELFCRRRSNPVIQDDTLFLRLGLVILLFFMMGITWVFGLLAQMFRNVVLDFLFGGTASLQGFALFVFFVVLNKNVRRKYAVLWKKGCYKLWRK